MSWPQGGIVPLLSHAHLLLTGSSGTYTTPLKYLIGSRTIPLAGQDVLSQQGTSSLPKEKARSCSYGCLLLACTALTLPKDPLAGYQKKILGTWREGKSKQCGSRQTLLLSLLLPPPPLLWIRMSLNRTSDPVFSFSFFSSGGTVTVIYISRSPFVFLPA